MPVIDAHALTLQEAQAQIVRNREELIGAGVALRTQLHQVVEWRAWYRGAPAAWLAGAFLAGYLLGRRPPLAPTIVVRLPGWR